MPLEIKLLEVEKLRKWRAKRNDWTLVFENFNNAFWGHLLFKNPAKDVFTSKKKDLNKEPKFWICLCNKTPHIAQNIAERSQKYFQYFIAIKILSRHFC